MMRRTKNSKPFRQVWKNGGNVKNEMQDPFCFEVDGLGEGSNLHPVRSAWGL